MGEKKDLFSLSIILYFQGKWEMLSKAQGKKVKAQYEEEKRKQERTNQQEVITKIVYFFHESTRPCQMFICF
jgi:type I site-specific restriction endonuclease